MIIGMLNQKGGVGKTTLSVSITHELARRTPTQEILIVDSDPQQSSLNWSEVREGKPPFTVIGLSKKSLHRDLPPIAKNYLHVVIDGPPRVTELSRSCIMASDLVIVPCTPSPYDIWASSETVNLIKEAQVYKEKLKGVFMINRKIINTAISREILDVLNEMALPVLSTQITQRVIFAESAADGKTVFDIDPDGKAGSEISTLVDEILALGGQ